MSELQFPKNPVVGQQYDFPPYRYYWDGTKWKTMGIGYNPVNDLRDELEPRIEERLLGVGAKIYRGSNGQYVQNGDVVPAETTHLRVLINGRTEEVRMSSFESGAVADLTETSAIIGGVAVTLHHFLNGGYQATDTQLQSITPLAGEQWSNITDNSIHVGDGITQSGVKIKTYIFASAGVANMITGETVTGLVKHSVGQRWSTGGTLWEVKTVPVVDIYSFKPLSDLNVKDFGAVGDDLNDDTNAFENALNVALVTQTPLYMPSGTYSLTESLEIRGRGLKLYGANKYRTVLKNSTNGNSVIQVGFDTGDPLVQPDRYDGQYSHFEGFTIEGNAATLHGIAFKGIIDDGLQQTSGLCSIHNVIVKNVGNGPAYRYSAWNIQTGWIEAVDCKIGVLLGTEANALNFDLVRCTRCDQGGLVTDLDPAHPIATAVVNFNQLTVQESGNGGQPAVELSAGKTYNFDTVYLEDNKSNYDIEVKGVASNVNFETINSAGGTPDYVVGITDAYCRVGSIQLYSERLAYVRVTGTAPVVLLGPCTSIATVGDYIIDDSTNKYTNVIKGNNQGTEFYNLKGKAPFGKSALSAFRSDTGDEVWKVQGSGYHSWSGGYELSPGYGGSKFLFTRNGGAVDIEADRLVSTRNGNGIKLNDASGVEHTLSVDSSGRLTIDGVIVGTQS